MNWFDVLNQYSNEALGAMCRAHRVAPYAGNVGPGNRVNAINALKKILGSKDGVAYSLKFMGPVETMALRALVRLGGTAQAGSIFNILKTEGAPMKPMRLGPNQQPTPDYQSEPHFEDALARATVFGLIFSKDSQRGFYWQLNLNPADTLFLPESVLLQLEAQADFAKPPATSSSQPAVVVATAAADFQRDLSRYWRHARKQREIAFTTQGWMYKANFKTFMAALNLPTDALNDEASNARLWFMRRLLNALGELEGDAGDPFLTVPDASKLLALPLADRIKQTYDAWRHTGAWNELLRLPIDHQGYDIHRDAPELGAARDAVLRTMAKLSAGHADEWINTNALIGQMRRTQYEFLFPRNKKNRGYSYGTPYSSMTANPYGIVFPTVRDEAMGWTLVEQAFMVQLLTGPLSWLGVVELGYHTNEQTGENVVPVSYRLSETGAWLLGIGEQPTFIESGGRVVVQPNFTILAMEPISDAVLIDLDKFADSQGGDRAIAFQLTRESLYRGQLVGWDAPRVLAFLEAHQGAPISTNVRRTVDEWELQHRRITFHRNAVVLQFADAEAQDETRPVLAVLQPRKLSDQVALVENGDAKHTLAALREVGWMPLSQPVAPSAESGVLRADDEGRVTFAQATPSVFVLGQLAGFAEVNARGHWHITPASVRGAIGKNLSVDQMLATLAELHIGALPVVLEKNIRKWGGFFGEASLQAVALLELSSFEVLANLAHDEEIGPLIAAIEGASKPLAVVAAANAEDVRRVLEERGVVFK